MRARDFRPPPIVMAALLAGSLPGASFAQSTAGGAPPGLLEAPAESTRFTLGEIKVVTSDIFEADRTERGISRLINRTHWTTRESVIQREIWRSPGETVDEAFAQELERNLRSLGLFAEVVVKLVPSGNPEAGANVRDLHVTTRDRFSLRIGAGASFVGAAASGNASLAESNLFGMGDRLRFSYRENDFGETRGDVAYFDRYVGGSWTSATVQAGRREEGNAYGLNLDRPFRHLEDKMAWNVSASTAGVDQDFFAANETVAEVPFDITSLSASVRWRSGSRMSFWTRGFSARYSEVDYFAARGPAAAGLRVPGDTQTLFAGGTLGFTDLSEFREISHLDTLEFVQDVPLGTTGSIEAGAAYRDEEVGGQAQTAAGQMTQPQVSLNLAETMAFGSSRYASARLSGFARLDGNDATGWRADLNFRAFDLSWRPHTLGLAVTYTEVEETDNLPVQLTLGENNGLRGYPNRELTGQRFLRINFEDRIDLNAQIAAFEIGAVVFGDAAWIGGRGADLEGPFTSAGIGLRVGSKSLLGNGILRADFSVPFDDANGESFDPLVSLTIGQVFSL